MYTSRFLAPLALVLPFAPILGQNLVINPSFETISSCPVGPSELDKATPWRDAHQNLVGDTCSTADLYNSCSPFGALGVGVPANILGNQPARTGVGYAGIIVYEGFALVGCQSLFGSGWREYLQGTLTEPLVAGQTYCVTFYVSLADNVKFASNNIGVYFSNTLVNVSCATVGSASNLPFTPQLVYSGPDLIVTNGWQRLQWDYTAAGGEQYLVIGNYNNDANTTYTCVNEGAFNPYAYYYVDDVSVVPEPCCLAEVAPVPPLCIGDALVTLQPATPGGTWSGPGIANPAVGSFDPTLAGVGVHTVFHTIPCGTDSVIIAVSPCQALEVCINDNGSLTVSNGVGPYNWQQQTTTEDCSACFLGCIFPAGCAVNVTTWVTFATGTSIPAPASFPIQVLDASGNTLLITSVAGLLPCVECPDVEVELLTRTDVLCFGENIGSASVLATGGEAPITYAWSPGNLNGASQTGLAAGNYTVTATDANGCSASLTVLIAGPSSALQASIQGTTPTTCGAADGTATVEATGGTPSYTYSWSPAGGTQAVATGLAEGSYTVAVTDANGCTTSAVAEVESLPSEANIAGNTALCTGDTIVLTATGGSGFLWNNGDTTASITVTFGGTYIVQVTGCGTDSDTLVVSETTVIADISADPISGDPPLEVLFGNASTPPNGAFTWDFGDGTTSTGATPAHTYDEPGIYTVLFTVSSNGCTATDSLIIVVGIPFVDSEITVPNVFSPNGDGMNDVWGVIGTGLTSLDAVVYNRWGQQVAQLSNPAQVWDGRTGAGEIASEGTYYYILKAEGADGQRYEFTGSLTLLR